MQPNCRSCGTALVVSLCDLGVTPFSNSFLRESDLDRGEVFYPLHPRVCEQCWLVQIPAFEPPESIFNDSYAYFSSYSASWLRHAERFCAEMIAGRSLGPTSQVVEIASNDGYLLQYFQQANIPVLGIEPSDNCAEVARAKGIRTVTRFFGRDTANDLRAEGIRADLVVANNVLAHVPDINDFVSGLKILLAQGGALSLEFPHLLRLIVGNQFDTVYHEHFSYVSLLALTALLRRHALEVTDVVELATHGGSLRVIAEHAGTAPRQLSGAVEKVIADERAAGLDTVKAYARFQEGVTQARLELLALLVQARLAGKRVWAYGAAAKGNTLLNYCGIRSDLVQAVVDRSPHKQGKFLPGVRIPVLAPTALHAAKPEYVLILPWNLQEEIMGQLAAIRDWKGQFIVPIPRPVVLP